MQVISNNKDSLQRREVESSCYRRLSLAKFREYYMSLMYCLHKKE